ncbi:acyl-CoA carboxylase subunit beta [Amycolatopsis sp. cmx-8-4]|uniref:acyl-CoA carboxylase subunit beta n=1 Tax=Amycolatopsis sp. cmx-8-4 TaxID=2790947 RepID=UPI00397B484B
MTEIRPMPATTADRLKELYRRTEEAIAHGSARAAERQHSLGRMTARERVEQLLDPGSFVELDAFVRHRSTNFGLDRNRPLGDGVVTGYGDVDGRPVCVYSQDASVFGGSLGETHGGKIVKVMDLAVTTGRPIVGINDGAGGRLQEGVVAQAIYGEIFRRNVRTSGVVPQISLILGSCAGGACYSPALTDFIVMVDGNSHMFLTGPGVIRGSTGEEVGMEELSGGLTHNTRSGNAHYLATSEEDAIGYVQQLLSYLPANNLSDPPSYASVGVPPVAVDLDTLIPDLATEPYDMRDAVRAVVDDGELHEVQELYAPNIIVGFARVEGRSVGIVANQPARLAGCLDISASEKAARFVRTCDAFNVPIVTFVDVPGFLPGTEQEWNGIIRRGAKLIYAYADASVPLVTVVMRKAYGGAYDVMGSKHLGADLNFAWPTAQIAVMGATNATDVLYRRAIAEAAGQGDDVAALRAKLAQEYEETLLTPYLAAEHGYIDAVIPPSRTREYVATGLRGLQGKRDLRPPRKHGNIPL